MKFSKNGVESFLYDRIPGSTSNVFKTFFTLHQSPNKITWRNNTKIMFGICHKLILISRKIRSRDVFVKYYYIQNSWIKCLLTLKNFRRNLITTPHTQTSWQQTSWQFLKRPDSFSNVLTKISIWYNFTKRPDTFRFW